METEASSPMKRQMPPEIASAICRNTASLNSLVTLARTSRLFHRYASQDIWHTLPSLIPIFDTMPEDAYRQEQPPRRPWAYSGMVPAVILVCMRLHLARCGYSTRLTPYVRQTASRPLKPDDLARFSLYAPFIRRIAPRDSGDWRWKKAPVMAAYTEYYVSPELWEMLQAIWPRHLLYLEVLKYRQVAYIDSKAYAHPLHLIIGPSLKMLDFAVLYLDKSTGRLDRRTDDTTSQDPALEVFFEQLPHLAPHITTFAFSTEVRVFARDALSQALCSLSHLTSVTVNCIPLLSRALDHLSTLPALQNLTIQVPPRDELVAEAWPTGRFTALRELDMRAVQIDECIYLLGHVSSISLHSIVVDVQEPSPTGTFQALASEVLAHSSSQTAIRSLAFTLHWVEGLPPEAFDPLLPLSALKFLVLSGQVCAAVDDETLCAMAQAWPKIQQLTLYEWGYDHMPQLATQATVHSLCHFARYCL